MRGRLWGSGDLGVILTAWKLLENGLITGKADITLQSATREQHGHSLVTLTVSLEQHAHSLVTLTVSLEQHAHSLVTLTEI